MLNSCCSLVPKYLHSLRPCLLRNFCNTRLEILKCLIPKMLKYNVRLQIRYETIHLKNASLFYAMQNNLKYFHSLQTNVMRLVMIVQRKAESNKKLYILRILPDNVWTPFDGNVYFFSIYQMVLSLPYWC